MQLLNLTYSAWGEELLRVLNTMRTTNDMCDVKLVLSDQILQAHSCILSATSPFFKSIFSGTENLEINLEDFPSRIVMHVLDFVYSGSSLFPKEDLEMLHSVATTLVIPGLVDLTQEMMMHSIPEEEHKESDDLPDTGVVYIKPSIDMIEIVPNEQTELVPNEQIELLPNEQTKHSQEVGVVTIPDEHFGTKIEQEITEDSISHVGEVMNDEIAVQLGHLHGSSEEQSAMEFAHIVDQFESSNIITSSEHDQVDVEENSMMETDDVQNPHNSGILQTETVLEDESRSEAENLLEHVEGTELEMNEVEESDVENTLIKTEDSTKDVQSEKLLPCTLKLVKDTEVPQGTPNRAAQTVPDGLTIKMTLQASNPSSMATHGVYTILPFPKGSLFGPYEGMMYLKEDAETLVNREYCWKIYKNGKYVHYIDGEDESQANWMRYVKKARDAKEQNLEAYQHDGRLYFKAIKDIIQFSELIVKYGNPLSTVLGTAYNIYEKSGNSVSDAVSNDIIERLKLSCEECGIIYNSEIIYHRHMQVKHGKELPLEIYEINQKGRTKRQCKFVKEEPSVIEKIPDENTINQVKTRSSCISPTSEKSTPKSTPKPKKVVKSKQEPISCSVCGKTFKNLSNLEIHKLIHSNQRPHTCPTCGRAFAQKSNMTAHMKTHTRDRTFVCSDCGKGFLRRGELRIHEQFHAPDNNAHVCDECGKGFKNLGNYKRHVKSHSGEKPYSCPVCARDFNRSENLKSHLRRHTGEKPFQCALCGTCFTENAHLQAHMRRHTGEKPFQCTQCGKGFVEHSALNVHLKSHKVK